MSEVSEFLGVAEKSNKLIEKNDTCTSSNRLIPTNNVLMSAVTCATREQNKTCNHDRELDLIH
jgi:hypothetical protein